MSENVISALKLMLVGMTTVFIILVFVVLLGKLLIMITNRFQSEQNILVSSNAIDQNHIAAINSAIQLISKGTKAVERIDRKD